MLLDSSLNNSSSRSRRREWADYSTSQLRQVACSHRQPLPLGLSDSNSRSNSNSNSRPGASLLSRPATSNLNRTHRPEVCLLRSQLRADCLLRAPLSRTQEVFSNPTPPKPKPRVDFSTNSNSNRSNSSSNRHPVDSSARQPSPVPSRLGNRLKVVCSVNSNSSRSSSSLPVADFSTRHLRPQADCLAVKPSNLLEDCSIKLRNPLVVASSANLHSLQPVEVSLTTSNPHRRPADYFQPSNNPANNNPASLAKVSSQPRAVSSVNQL